jgi:putative DNA primase/helicase
MNKELPLPDNRLNGKVRLEQVVVPIKRDVLRVALLDSLVQQPDAKTEISRLAGLEKLEYEGERKQAAKRLQLRITALDGLVAAEHGEVDGGDKQGRALNLPEPEPWPDPVNGANVLDELSAIVRQYVVLSASAADTVALWVAHTYLIGAFGISPRLAITSPEKRCGKTTLLDVLARLVVRPLPTSNATTAAIFRVVEMEQPTLLIDEADTFLKEDSELRGILNSGHRQGGSVLRVVGENHEPRSFSTYSACAIALIGKLPETLTDRSVAIDLRRRRPDEQIEAFRFDRTGPLDRAARRAARWALDYANLVSGIDPTMPAGVYNRAADNWRPLLAIADAAGGGWPERARRAVKAAGAGAGDHDQSVRVMLLADIRNMFAKRNVDRLASADIVEGLVAIEGRPWPEWKAGKPITPTGLARQLARFGIKPDSHRIESRTPKGYLLAQFEDAFARYLPPATATPQQP